MPYRMSTGVLEWKTAQDVHFVETQWTPTDAAPGSASAFQAHTQSDRRVADTHAATHASDAQHLSRSAHHPKFFRQHLLRAVFRHFYIRDNLSRALRAEGTA